MAYIALKESALIEVEKEGKSVAGLSVISFFKQS
jgi:hypothetical protein